VVIPVYNPGSYIGDCIRSMIGEVPSGAEYEVVFVDDGSTDDTPALLDKIAAEHTNIRVVHEQNSGWSGRPRNVGIDCSQGEYVMFVDHDDSLGAQALERLYEYGTAHNGHRNWQDGGKGTGGAARALQPEPAARDAYGRPADRQPYAAQVVPPGISQRA
jgi:glycosyltransferase involved in cell wall biosynthesis